MNRSLVSLASRVRKPLAIAAGATSAYCFYRSFARVRYEDSEEDKTAAEQPSPNFQVSSPRLRGKQYTRSHLIWTPALIGVRLGVFQIHLLYLAGAVSFWAVFRRWFKLSIYVASMFYIVFQAEDVMSTSSYITDLVLSEDKKEVTICYGIVWNRSKTYPVAGMSLGSEVHRQSGWLTVMAEKGGWRHQFYLDKIPVLGEQSAYGWENVDLLEDVLNGRAEEVQKYEKIERI